MVQLFKATQTTNTPTLIVSYGGPFGENWFYTHENVQGDAKLRRFTPEDRPRRTEPAPRPGAGGSPGRPVVRARTSMSSRGTPSLPSDDRRTAPAIGVGSHGQLQGLGYHWELWAMATGGIAPHDVLRAATIYGAEAIGMGKDLASLEPARWPTSSCSTRIRSPTSATR